FSCRSLCVLTDFFFLMIRRPPRSTLFPYTDALPILPHDAFGKSDTRALMRKPAWPCTSGRVTLQRPAATIAGLCRSSITLPQAGDRKSTRLNSSHVKISYAVFCLKKKKKQTKNDKHK